MQKGCNLFTFTHSKFYSDVQVQFLTAVNTHDPQALTNLLHMFPYHIDSLLQLSEVYKASGNAASAADFIGMSHIDCDFGVRG